MGVPEARLNRSRKGSKLCLNSTRMKDIPGETITVPDSVPISPDGQDDNHKNLFTQTPSATQDSSQAVKSPCSSVGESSASLAPPAAPVASFYNLGNTCFMNCMLHVLRFTPEFLQLLDKLRSEVDAEEKMLTLGKTEAEPSDSRQAWQLLRNLHDMYADMAHKECQCRKQMPASTSDMALQPLALLDSIRLLNPLFEGNMQHDAQELLRCLLCGLDDAELELRRLRQERLEKGEKRMEKSQPEAVGCQASKTNSQGQPVTPPDTKDSSSGFTFEEVKNLAKSQPALKGGRSRGRKRKKEEEEKKKVVTNASKGLMASFLKAKEVPAIVTKIGQQQREPMEGVGVAGRVTPVCMTDADASTTATAIIGSEENRLTGFDQSLASSLQGQGSSPEPGTGTNESPSAGLGHEGYLTSVRHTEGRRSRLGVRGPAKSFPVCNQDGKSSVPNAVSLPPNADCLFEPLTSSDIGDRPRSGSLSSRGAASMSCRKSHLDAADKRDESQLACHSAGIASSPSRSLLTAVSPCSSLDEVDEIVELPLLCDKSEPKQSPIRKIEDNVSDSPQLGLKDDEEEKPVLLEGSPSQILLTPGKEFTIHSISKRRTSFYTSPPALSRNFLSRFGSLIPSSAKRFLSFSQEDSLKPREVLQNDQSSHSLQTKSHESTVVEKVLMSSQTSFLKDEVEESIREARIHLKRCDWLGVSPVKTVSASRVIRQISNVRLQNCFETKNDKSAANIVGPAGDFSSNCHPAINHRKRTHSGKFVCSSKGDVIDAGNSNAESRSQMRKPLIDLKHLPQLSISLQRCDGLMKKGRQSVVINNTNSQSLDVPKKTMKNLSPTVTTLKPCAESVKSELKAEPLVMPLTASSASGNPTARLVYNLFGGTMSHQTRCCECESVSGRSEEFLDISIPVPKTCSTSGDGDDDDDDDDDDDEAFSDCDKSVSRLLQSLASRERIYGENKYFCDSCHHLVEAERSSHLTALPKVLTLHLKRFHASFSTFGGVAKINDHVTVPVHLPCLLHKCRHDPSVCSHRYSLYAVVTHSGASIRHGHYRTYVKVPHTFSRIAEYKGAKGRRPRSPCGHSHLPTASAPRDACPAFDIEQGSLSMSSLPVQSSSNLASAEDHGVTSNLLPDVPWSRKERNDEPQSLTQERVEKPCVEKYQMWSSDEDNGKTSCWWLECDDDYIQVFEEEEFLGKLSQSDGYLLGTPYVLFYQQMPNRAFCSGHLNEVTPDLGL